MVFGSGRLSLFKAIDRFGSINRAAELGMSYRRLGKNYSYRKHLGIKLKWINIQAVPAVVLN